jgi:hypothetical protein
MKTCHGFSLPSRWRKAHLAPAPPSAIDDQPKHRRRTYDARLKCVEAYEATHRLEASSTAQWSGILRQIRLQEGAQQRAERVRIVAGCATSCGGEKQPKKPCRTARTVAGTESSLRVTCGETGRPNARGTERARGAVSESSQARRGGWLRAFNSVGMLSS